jgi:hypothetical protein
MPLLVAVLISLLGLVAATPARAAAERPLVYVIVVDGLDGDTVDAGGMPFVSSLLAGEGASATYFQESRSVIPSETNPNHTAMMTGAYPGNSGVAGNIFALYAPLENEDSCKPTGPFDFSKAPTPTSGESAECMLAETVFESIGRQRDQLVTAAVFGKPKLGRLFVKPGVDHLWAPCDDEPDDDAYCGDVPTNPISGYAMDDALVMDEVVRTVEQGVGPDGVRPDFTFVNLHQIDSAGHAFGRGTAYQLATGMADDQLERLVGLLRERGEWDRTVMILASDHSMDTTLTHVTMSGEFEDAGIPDDKYVVVQNGGLDAIYLADRTSPDRFELLKRMRATALETEGVTEALYREPNPADGGNMHTIANVHPGWHTEGPRTGDLILTSDPGVAFSDPSETTNPLPGNHGGPLTRDNFTAVVGGSDFVRQQTIGGTALPGFDDTLALPQQSENVDIAPTVMGLFGLGAPRHNRGRFLANALELGRLPGAGRPEGRPRVRVRRCKAIWGPKGARFDVQVKRRGAYTTLLRDTTRTRAKVAGKRVRVRLRAASGRVGSFRSARIAC